MVKELVVESMYLKLGKWVNGDKDLSVSTMTEFVVEIMQLSEELNIPGNEKKELTLKVVNKLIIDSNIQDKENLLFVANCVIPCMIDKIIEIDKRKIRISKGGNFCGLFL